MGLAEGFPWGRILQAMTEGLGGGGLWLYRPCGSAIHDIASGWGWQQGSLGGEYCKPGLRDGGGGGGGGHQQEMTYWATALRHT